MNELNRMKEGNNNLLSEAKKKEKIESNPIESNHISIEYDTVNVNELIVTFCVCVYNVYI